MQLREAVGMVFLKEEMYQLTSWAITGCQWSSATAVHATGSSGSTRMQPSQSLSFDATQEGDLVEGGVRDYHVATKLLVFYDAPLDCAQKSPQGGATTSIWR